MIKVPEHPPTRVCQDAICHCVASDSSCPTNGARLVSTPSAFSTGFIGSYQRGRPWRREISRMKPTTQQSKSCHCCSSTRSFLRQDTHSLRIHRRDHTPPQQLLGRLRLWAGSKSSWQTCQRDKSAPQIPASKDHPAELTSGQSRAANTALPG
jgi:hypothetical protein